MLEPRAVGQGYVIVAPRRVEGGYLAVKRVVDLLVSGTALLMLSPLFVAVAAAIKLDTRGPVLFRQERIGARRVREDGVVRWEPVPFTFFKFRTMNPDASSALHQSYIAAYINGDSSKMAEAAGAAAGTNTYKLVNDPRVTRVGRMLRKLSIDELPQLWNVFRGDMSLVGPRPAIGYEVEMYKEHHYGRLAAKPGITGLWQVSGRAEIGFEEMVELDCEYIEKRSLRYDLALLLRTIPVVLSTRGAG